MSEPILAEIKISNIIKNVKKVKTLLKKKVLLCAVVKSDAYGHGIVEVASLLYKHCDYFAVSLLNEAISLRLCGIDKPIIILSPVTENTVDGLILRDITLSVSTLSELYLISKRAKKLDKRVKVHLAINTGMNRLGFSNKKEILKAISFIKSNKLLTLDGAYSHFGDVCNNAYTESAYLKFLSLTKPIKKCNKNAILHISASGGLLKNQKYQLDRVRVGLLLYGYAPIQNNKIKVLPVMKIKAKNLLIRNGIKGEHLLYGNKTVNKNSACILRLGYADGFLRRETLPFISNLCMDLSAVKGNNGLNYVTVMDDAEKLAREYKTIPYEVLVSVSKRAYKKYI